MYKITLLFMLLASTLSSFAQTSRLTIFSEDAEPFYLFLNSIRQNESAVVNIAVDYLPNDYYDVKVVFANQNLPQIQKKYLATVDVDGAHGEFVYKIKNGRKGRKLRFFSFTPFQAVLPPPNNVAVIPFNAVPLPPIHVTTQTTTTTTTNGGGGINIGVQTHANTIGMGVQVNTGNTNTTTTQTTTTTISTLPNSTVTATPDCYAMSVTDFNGALKAIENKSFSDSKLALAKQITRGSCLTAAQIAAITKLFDFESTKLEYAKFAYAYCYNPENYWKINEAFDFDSSTETLNQYIESLGY
ncbi:DUF4476 domain-containing protein [Bizionia sediminis]|uniref:DUF4476 domain-containing protein n=1 Tax=Bizionia sediminis TaxID=1737064 RepID=A0ABW5KWC0_9FLAO